MIIAIPAEEKSLDSVISVNFGRSPYFCIYDTEKQQSTFIDNEAAGRPGGAGVEAAQNLVNQKIDTLVAFRLGDHAAKVLSGAKIKVLKAVNLSIADNIAKVLSHSLEELNEVHPGGINKG
ncbi:MAG TPA: NifB/NifX family molybdenum-iron cluster-binding protein [Sphaerochaeta sp.]|jgi:predicted Fe-Mo cluster-binding NifX family protein|nr:dinitrogenase iron-molybdenum cofactor biosynthesis protein [Spirochaetales bacterium]HPX29395.1 NifB/NifX family molybdenum-iron cluster-binding protein [Sphaerochaeta sp.]HQB55227.1 NifB/NifX family molybdenum-iron cluster-binding protein [Sphaerochaeta sp.]